MFLIALVFCGLWNQAVALNYFWLSWDPHQSAQWYCDQHCFKIGSETVESIWDSVLVICPELSIEADALGLTKATRKRRHAKDGGLWHPLSVWHGLCRANMNRGLINANAIFEEHYRRTGTKHVAWKDCLFLMKNVDRIDFSSSRWKAWYLSQSGEDGTPHTPIKTKTIQLASRREWCLQHARNILAVNRDVCEMTEPPQCINEDIPLFAGCRVPGDVVAAYRKYYQAKLYSMGVMRYYYTLPPRWILGFKRQENDKIKLIPYRLDDDGYVMVVYVL